jgi:hypothetical protein
MLGHGRQLDWPAGHGVLTVQVFKAGRAAGRYALVFKVSWGG